MYEGMAWWRCSEVRHTPPNCLGWGPEAQRGMSIPSARLSGKSRRLPTANNHTQRHTTRACLTPTATLGATCTHGTRTRGITGQPTHAAHCDSIDVHLPTGRPHSSTSHTDTGVRTLPATAATPFTGVARAASLACIAARTATSGSTRTRTSGAVPSELGRAPSPTTLTRSAPSATARQQLMAQSFATGLCVAQPAELPKRARRGEDAEAALATAGATPLPTAWNPSTTRRRTARERSATLERPRARPTEALEWAWRGGAAQAALATADAVAPPLLSTTQRYTARRRSAALKRH
jgi:hypothetical protein